MTRARGWLRETPRVTSRVAPQASLACVSSVLMPIFIGERLSGCEWRVSCSERVAARVLYSCLGAVVYCSFASVLTPPKVTGSQRSKVNCTCVCMCLGLSFGFCDIDLFVRPNVSDPSGTTPGLAVLYTFFSSHAIGSSVSQVYPSCQFSRS